MNFAGGRLHAGLASVLETALDSVCVMDSGGVIVGWNEHAATTFGWTHAEAVGQRLSDLIIPPPLRKAHEAGLSHYLETGVGPVLHRRIDVSAIHRAGHEFPVELSISATEQYGTVLFVGFLRDISERHEAAERQQRLLQESDHRVKNMLTVVSAIAQQTARASDDMDSFLDSFSGRLDSLARSHSLLAGKEWRDVAITAIAEQVLSSDVAEGRARFGGPEILLPARQVLGLSMILHELYTNAVKYGALCSEEGFINLDWTMKNGEVELRWAEKGPPCTPEAPSSGFGQRMIAMAVKSDLDGTIDRNWSSVGLTATIRFPLTN